MSKRSEAVIRWRKRTKTKSVIAMGGACVCCGYDRCFEAMDFHHIDPSQKDFGMGSLRASPRNVKTLIEELKKCVLVCANCHREIHAGVRSLPATIPPLDEEALLSEAALRRKIKQQNAQFMQPKDRRKIKLSRLELEDLLREYGGNKSQLARHLSVSETAIRKRLRYNDR